MRARVSGEHQAALRVLPVWGRYTASGQIELNGSRQELHMLAAALAGDQSGQPWRLKLPPAPDPAPYESFLGALRIVQSIGKVRVGRERDVLIFTGSQAMLDILAHNVKWLADKADPSPSSTVANYLHVEYHPDHFYLDSTSKPLVL